MNLNRIQQRVGNQRWREIVFALNVAFAITFALFSYAAGSYHPIYASNLARKGLVAFQALLIRLAPLNASRPRSSIIQSWLSWELAFLAVMLSTSIVLVSLWRVSERFRLGEGVLHLLSGVTSLVAVPVCWLYVINATGVGSGGPQGFWNTYGTLSSSEVGIVVCVLYLLRKQPVWCGGLVFTIHFIFWIVVISEQSAPPVFVSIPLSLVFPCSGFVWLLGRREVRQSPLTVSNCKSS